MMNWPSYSDDQMNALVDKALEDNINYGKKPILGVPGSYLDEHEFSDQASFLKDAPYLKTLIANPNHIGCHTLDNHQFEAQFKGTQSLEKEVIDICANEIFRAKKETVDGYVCSGGTEANIQAIWAYRNYFMNQLGYLHAQVGVLFSSDSHYSMSKAANLLNITPIEIQVHDDSRSIDMTDLGMQLHHAKKQGIEALIVVLNMGTTMFGSIDDIDPIIAMMGNYTFDYKIHIDGAFGGFIYPFTNESFELNFQHPKIHSITIDGHKMLQAPYGTGILLIRKPYLVYTVNADATYVQGLDCTLSGSRSGANAVALWKILHHYGPDKLKAKMNHLIEQTNQLCKAFDDRGIQYFRQKGMNIVTIPADQIPSKVAQDFVLVPDSHGNHQQFWKIVLMPHVNAEIINQFLTQLDKELKNT